MSGESTLREHSIMPMTLESLRAELPITDKAAYFNTGGHGPPPDSVLKAVSDEMALQAHNYGLPSVSSEQAAREKAAREGLARFIHAKPEEVALTPNTTQAMRQVSQSIGWSEGDEFVITSLEHVSTVSLGTALEQDVGVTLSVVEADRGDAEFLETLRSSLSERSKLLCISHVASPDGRVLPVAEAADLAHERGVPVVVDTAQSLGQFPVDVPALNCDFMVGSGHKWLLGPMGVGILWVSSDHLPSFRPNPVPEREPWSPPDSPIEAPTAAHMAEKGTHNTAMVIGTGRAIEVMDEIGPGAVAAHTGRLSSILREAAAEMDGVNVLTPTEPGRSAGLTTLTFDGYSPDDLRGLVSRIYEEHNAVVKFQWLTAPMRLDRIGMRISVAAFNTEDEVNGLIDAIREGASRL